MDRFVGFVAGFAGVLAVCVVEASIFGALGLLFGVRFAVGFAASAVVTFPSPKPDRATLSQTAFDSAGRFGAALAAYLFALASLLFLFREAGGAL